MDTYLGVDVGTSNVKALLCDASGAVIGSAERPYPTYRPAASSVEQDPEDWWEATCSAVAELAAKGLLDSVAALAFSSQAPTLLAVDESGHPLRPAMIWMDRRAEAQCREAKGVLGSAEYLRRAGNRIDPFYVAPKVRWLSENEPAVLRSAAALLQIPGYLAHRVTGEFSLDISHASILGLGQPNEWDALLLDFARIGPGQLPRSVLGSTVIGYSRAGALPGVPAGIPVAAGTVDSAAAALEVDLDQNEALLMTGTSSVLVMPRVEREPCEEFISMALPGGGWCDLAAVVSSGSSVAWLAQLASLDVAEFMELSAQSVPGAHGLVFLPYLAGERSPWWDTSARGGFFGLTSTHTLGDLARAVLEGTALALRQNLTIAMNTGHDIRRLAANGGPARNALWNQIISDVTDLPIVSHSRAGGSAFGCCRLAARSVGVEMPPMRGSTTVTIPSEGGVRDRYDELFAAYDGLYPALRETTRRLTGLMEEQHA